VPAERSSSPARPKPTRLHIVTGKGGTGKTTIAAALALALATGGKRVLLVEVENRQGIAQLFDTPPLPYEEKHVAVAPAHGEVIALAIDPEEALLDYLDMFYNLRRAGRLLKRLGAIDFATTIAPGLRDVLLTGKIKEAVDRRGPGGKPVYDSVVVDAPPTGRITRFLNVTSEVGSLARVGPIKNQSDSVQRVIHTEGAVHVVTVLEEMPVQETIDGIAELRAATMPIGSVFVNMRREPYAIPKRLGRAKVAAGLTAAGLPASKALVEQLLAEAGELRSRVALQDRETEALAGLSVPLVQLPMLTGAVDLGGLYRLAELLVAQGFPA
jgi:anion-transporting  ArsA/GET3 family ATPase